MIQLPRVVWKLLNGASPDWIIVGVVQLVWADQLVCLSEPLVPTVLVAPLHVAYPAVSLDQRCLQTVFDTSAQELVNLFGRLRNHLSHHVLTLKMSSRDVCEVFQASQR